MLQKENTHSTGRKLERALDIMGEQMIILCYLMVAFVEKSRGSSIDDFSYL